jgi:hypothetical protein
MSYAGNRQQVESYNTQAIPQSLQGNDSPMAVRGKVTQVSVPNLNGDQKSNGKLRFVLPNNNVSISRRSMYIRLRCSIPQSRFSGSVAGTSAANSIWFQGPGWPDVGGAANAFTHASFPAGASGFSQPQLGNAYSLIQRSTIYSGSVVVDMIDYVCDLMSGLILPHATNANWIQSDGTALLAITTPLMSSVSGTSPAVFYYWDLAIPVPHSCFNTERDFPAYLLSESNPLSVEIDLTSFARAIAIGTGITALQGIDYTLSSAALCYESVELPREFIEAQRLATKKIPFVIPQLSYMINQMAISALANYNINLKLSSLRAAYILPFNGASYNSAYVTAQFAYQRNAGDVATGLRTGLFNGTNAQLFVDGRCINQVNLDNPTMTFVALKQALKGSITDYSSSSIACLVSYKNCYFAIGIDTTTFSDESTVMGGTPVDQAQIVLTNFNTNATTGAYLANVIFAYDSLLVIKNGKVEVKR